MFRFTIRDLLWLMVVVGTAAAWYAERRAKPERINELLQEHSDLIQAAGEQGFVFVKMDNGYVMRGGGSVSPPAQNRR